MRRIFIFVLCWCSVLTNPVTDKKDPQVEHETHLLYPVHPVHPVGPMAPYPYATPYSYPVFVPVPMTHTANTEQTADPAHPNPSLRSKDS